MFADRRQDGAGSLKASKDRDQAAFLMKALADGRPHELHDAYVKAKGDGARWREHITNSLTLIKRTQDLPDGLEKLT